MTRDELGPRTEPTRPGSLASVSTIARMAGVRKQNAYRLTRMRGFPRPQDDLGPGVGRIWDRAQVQQWLDERRGSKPRSAEGT